MVEAAILEDVVSKAMVVTSLVRVVGMFEILQRILVGAIDK